MTTDPKTARRVFVLLAVLILAMIAIGVWTVILRDWLFLALWAFCSVDMVGMATRHFSVGWPGSRLDCYRELPWIRLSKAQGIVAGLIFVAATAVALIAFAEGNRVALLAFVALLALVDALWLARTIRRKGWRRKKEGKS